MCDVGAKRRISDGAVIKNTKFYEKLTNNCLMKPPDENPMVVPLRFRMYSGDEAFSLRWNSLNPFNNERVFFNYKLSRAKRINENAFLI